MQYMSPASVIEIHDVTESQASASGENDQNFEDDYCVDNFQDDNEQNFEKYYGDDVVQPEPEVKVKPSVKTKNQLTETHEEDDDDDEDDDDEKEEDEKEEEAENKNRSTFNSLIYSIILIILVNLNIHSLLKLFIFIFYNFFYLFFYFIHLFFLSFILFFYYYFYFIYFTIIYFIIYSYLKIKNVFLIFLEKAIIVWTIKMTKALIVTYADVEKNSFLKDAKLWKRVSSLLNDLGHNVPQEECKSKWDALCRRYKKTLENIKKTGSSPDNSFKHFNEMNSILYRRPTINPPAMASSIRGYQNFFGITSLTPANKRRKISCSSSSSSSSMSMLTAAIVAIAAAASSSPRGAIA